MLTASSLLRLYSGEESSPRKAPLKNEEKTPKEQHWLNILHVPLMVVFCLVMSALLLQHVYHTIVFPIVASYKRGRLVGDFYDDFRNEFTYYNRHCSAQDISTTDSSDLLIDPKMTSDQAADVMLQHGAVAFQNVLTPDVASNLRHYLADKHAHPLHYNEVFWQEQDRLALALGTHDDPAIAAALEQVGKHETLKKTLEGILGEDPAIVEVSTLTSMAGSSFQAIHTDSDWFGSSLLYGQTFLHSHTLFIALQDTSEHLGATTVCPGAHLCADIDLEQVCLENGAFSVSTNGKTGDDGLLYQGDAFLFNQNIWHRGPGNRDHEKDRIMFILTFTSSNKHNPDDLRRQGLGTYYYQRWNMWSHTWQDLKMAGTKMVQPWGALRAVGLLPAKGITWIHQFAQQMANGNDFYDEYVLDEFKEKILDGTVPDYLKSDARHWEQFIPETMQLWTSFLVKVYAAVAVPCLMLSLGLRNRSFVKTSFLLHGLVCLVMYGLLWHIKHTELGQSVETGKIWERPFPVVEREELSFDAPTTLPERNDVLFSSRLNADYLASFKRFLDFHPGNKRWLEMVKLAASELPASFGDRAVEVIVQELLASSEAGLPIRFLRQDYATGYWLVMTEQEALEETRRALVTTTARRAESLVEAQKLQYDLAKASSTEKWMASIFMEPTCLPRANAHSNDLKPGDQIWAYDGDSRTWYEATLVAQEDDDEYRFDFFWGGKEIGHGDSIRPYVALQSGDRVEVDYHGNQSEFFQGTITAIHPDGTCGVLYDDGEYVERNRREFMFRLDDDDEE